MNVNEFLQKYRKVAFGMNVTRPRVLCADGYTVSVQAGKGIYSSPRDDADTYDTVELGYPSAVDHAFLPYAENPELPLDTVYAQVPVQIVDSVICLHGGIVGADFSNDQAGCWKEHTSCPENSKEE